MKLAIKLSINKKDNETFREFYEKIRELFKVKL